MSAVGQLAGFALFALVAFLFGATRATDTFFLALAVPTLVSGPVVNSIHSVFVPVITASRIRSPASTGALAGAAFGWVSVVGVVATVALAVAAPAFARLVQVPDGIRDDIILQTQLLAPLIALQSVSGILQAILNADGRFLRPALAFALRHAVACGLLLSLHGSYGARALVIAFVGGALVQVAWLGLQVREVSFSLRPSLRVAGEFRGSLAVAGPLIVSSVLLQGGAFALRALASGLPAGSVTVLDYATRLVGAVIELVGSGVLLVSMVNWSELAARGDLGALRSAVRDAVFGGVLLLAPVAAVLFVVRADIVAVAFGHGQLDASGRLLTATLLGLFGLAFPLEIIARLFLRLFLAWHDTRLLAFLACLRIAVIVIGALALRGPLGVTGLAVAEVASLVAYAGVLAGAASRRFADGLQLPWLRMGRAVLVALVSGGAATLSRDWMTSWPPLLAGLAAGMLGMIVYAGFGALTGDLLEIRRRVLGVEDVDFACRSVV